MDYVSLCGAFATGLATSVGPCAAPRYLTLAALVADANAKVRWTRAGWFIGGLVCCYLALAVMSSWAALVLSLSRVIYMALAAGFLCAGLNQLVARTTCSHTSTKHRSNGSLGLVGAGLGLVFSPCCTPIIALAGSYGAATASTGWLFYTLAFVAGHIAPLGFAACGLRASRHIARGYSHNALATVSAGLMIALALYYGMLA
jgi:cytochrome c biogenesis protein CcdA